MATALGEKVKAERKRLQLTLEQLADRSGSSKSYIWELENRPAIRPSAEKISRIADVLGVTTEYLLDDEKQTPDDTDVDRVFFRRFSKLDDASKEKLKKIMEILEDDD
ncbi:helix-turn-helix domain-containing protein [Bordetella petrii]|uniref:HTH-type transcriptional regulator n=1 Tax=Bordetella petrii (strain ATCC BAA-461 / DSM 12804 / CCUG 43448 / CIP 107267 / Se-1111R) TaxID=340100 RepID=A9IF85_BORPD|nr:helix-turn-helix transcriptional regulator [Bordetella petrii]CAP44990.1 HTH-type transcriptional regulator [Bordetella petrii]